jgi:hypothetical protein
MIPYFTLAKYAVIAGGVIAAYHMLPVVGAGARIHSRDVKITEYRNTIRDASADITRKWQRIEQLQQKRDATSDEETQSRTRVERSCREQVRNAVSAIAARCPSGGVRNVGEDASLQDAWAAGRYKARVPGSSENKK